MRRLSGTAVAALLWLGCTPGRTAAHEAAYLLGRDGWSLERFGADVVVLRTSVLPGAGAQGRPGLLFVSCAAGARRLRLSLPEPILPDASAPAAGDGLVRSSRGTFLVAAFSVSGGRILDLSDAGQPFPGAVAAFAGLLRDRPERLDLLLRVRKAPRSLAGLVALRLGLSYGAADRLAFDEFFGVCSAGRR